jgi:SP family general alpha glucoside:H+ symporter-like MFS transporter
MESYDTILLGSFYAYPTFQKKFGDKIGANSYSVPAQWQTALGMGANIGIVIGIFANGFLIDKFGRE